VCVCVCVYKHMYFYKLCVSACLCAPMCLFKGGHREVDFGQRLYVRTNAQGMDTLAHAEREGQREGGGVGGREGGREGKRA